MSHNSHNFGQVIGRLTRDPQVFVNSDGSRKVLFTVAAARNYKNSANQKDSDFIPLEAFIPATRTDLGVYGYIHKGDKVTVAYTLHSSTYTDKKTNQPVYKVAAQVQDVTLEESKATVAARAATYAAQAAAQAAAQGPVMPAEVPIAPEEGVVLPAADMPEGEDNPFQPC